MYTKNICILGGGTAGLISALVLKSAHEHVNIRVIRSESIDIVGVGEGSTEHWALFMQHCNLNVLDLFQKTEATLKYGIYFKNWNGDNQYYMHNVDSHMAKVTVTGYPYIMHKNIAEDISLVPNYTKQSKVYPPLETASNQYHFDTFKLNEYLQDECIKRNIEIVVDTITDVVLDNTGIKELKGNKSTYVSDFFIDSSGFSKFLISRLGAEWIDCTENLPVNAAITFPTEMKPDEEIPAYTQATAMSAGWIWKIPTQTRYGNGYVYCDKFITEEQALAEAETLYGHKLNVVKRFKFGAGYLKNPWIKNCVAVGLSGSFIEPLEATNIGTAIQQAFGIMTYLHHWEPGDEVISEKYNYMISAAFQNIVDFIQIHYFTKREDSDFWKYCKTLKKTEFNHATLDVFKEKMPMWFYFSKPYFLFNQSNWAIIMHGLGLLDIEKYKKTWKDANSVIKLDAEVKHAVNQTREKAELPFSHRDAIEQLLRR
jgi:hypothetical protein